MKYATVFFLLLSASIAHAQTSDTAAVPEPWKDIRLGPIFSAGAAANAGTVAEGSKTAYAFAFSAGAIADYPLNQNIAFDLGLAYDARGINFHDLRSDSNKVDYTFGYFNIRPEFRFSGFLIGVGIGIPVSFSANGGGTAKAPALGASAMTTLFELRLGGTIPIIQSDLGELDFTVDGSYAFSSIVSDANGPLPYSGTSTNHTDNNGPLATAEIGLKYLFNLTHN